MKKLTTTLLLSLALAATQAADKTRTKAEADAQLERATAYNQAIDACHLQYRLRMQEIEARIREHNPDFCGTAQYTLQTEDPKGLEKSLFQELDKLPMDDDLRVIRYLSFPEMAQQTGQTDWAKQVDIEKLSIPVLAAYSLHCMENRDACDWQAPLKALQEQEPDWAVTWLLTLQTIKEDEDPQDILALLANSEKIQGLWVQPELVETQLLHADQVLSTDTFQQLIRQQNPENPEDLEAFSRHNLARHSISMASNDGLLIRLWVFCSKMKEAGNMAAVDDCMRFARKLLSQPQSHDEWGVDTAYRFAIEQLKEQGAMQEAMALTEQREQFNKQSSAIGRYYEKITTVACNNPQARALMTGWMERELHQGRIAAYQWFTQQNLPEFQVLDRKKLMKEYGQDLMETADAELNQCIKEAQERWYPALAAE